MAEELNIPTEAPTEGAPVEATEEEVTLPSDEVAFEMPEKFAGKSAEEIAKSYMELESFKNKPEAEPEEEVKETEDVDKPNESQTTEQLIEEYTSRGTDLTEEDYKTLEEKGYSKRQVDIYKAGIEAENQKAALATIEKAGTTADEATNAANWARENWSEERVTQFNEAIDGSSESVQIQMLQMLTESYRSNSVPVVDGNVHGQGNTQAKAPVGYESMEQMVSDMSDARYDPASFKHDPAYYKAVRAKAAKSEF